MSIIRDKTAIVGIGATEFSRNSGETILKMATESIKDAVEDAGLNIEDIDGMVSFTSDEADQIEIVRSLGIPNLKFFSMTPYGGGGSCGTVAHAVAAVNAGLANYVVCFRSLRDASAIVSRGDFNHEKQQLAPVNWSQYHPYGLLTPVSWIAMYTQRYMHEYGVKDGDFGWVSLVNRENANRNPKAIFYDRTLSMEEYMESPINVAPIRRHDSCLNADGSIAVIVTTADRAKHLKQRPAYISGVAQATSTNGEVMTSFNRKDLTSYPEIEEYGKQLFKNAGVSPWDIDVAQFYDAFSSEIPMQLEALGYVGKGEGVDFIKGGHRIRPDGDLPINTSGGLMSEGYIHGLNLIAEGVRQIRGTSTSQIKDAELSLVTGGPGVPTSGLILRRL